MYYSFPCCLFSYGKNSEIQLANHRNSVPLGGHVLQQKQEDMDLGDKNANPSQKNLKSARDISQWDQRGRYGCINCLG